MAITRKEKLLSAIANGTSPSIKPVTREEQLLSDIAKGTVSKVSPITRKEILLSDISKGQKPNIYPITREEQYLAHIGGGSSKHPENPITMTEFWLDKIANKGGGGGGGGSTDQTALAGAYTADGTFSNRKYTWDEMVERRGTSSPPYFDVSEEDRYVEASGFDIVVPDTEPYVGYFYCNNIVLPKTTTKVEGSDASKMGKVYVKATTPPELYEWAFFECTDVEIGGGSAGQVGAFGGIVVPVGCLEAYKSATNWSLYADYITEGEMPI